MLFSDAVLPLHAYIFSSPSLPSSHTGPLTALLTPCHLLPEEMLGISTHLLILDLSLTNPFL